MTYFCYQGNDRDCGFASLKMLLANKTKNKSYLYIEKPQKKKNYSFYDLINYAEKYGVKLFAAEYSKEMYKELPQPCLVLIDKTHLVYLKKIGKNFATVYDPYEGKRIIKTKEFLEMWTGKAVQCESCENAERIKLRKPRMTPLWMDILHYCIAALAFSSLMLGFYLIKDDSSIVVTMIFLLLFGLTELVENWYIIKEFKFFDNKYISKFFSLKKNQNYKKYSFYTNFKTKYFITSKLLISNLIIIGAFSILLCVNDYRNIFIFLILFLLKMLDNSLFSKSEKDDLEDIEKLEAVAFDANELVIRNITKANKIASRSALHSSLKKTIYLFLCLVISIGMMMMSKVTSTNFVIFHLGVYFLMSESFEHIIKYFSNRKDYHLKQAQFFDECDL